MSRLKTVTDELIAKHGRENTILINAGDNFCKKKDVEIEKKKTGLVSNAYSRMGVDIVSPGRKDFMFGMAFLNEFGKDKPFKMVCSNIFENDKTDPYFKPYFIFEKAGKRVLVTSAVDPVYEDLSPGIRIADPVDAIKSVQKKVPHDIFILVVYTNKDTAKNWLDKIPGIDMTVSGYQCGIEYKKEMMNDSLFVFNNMTGRTLAYVDIQLSDNTRDIEFGSPRLRSTGETEVKEEKNIHEMIREFKKWEYKYNEKKKAKLILERESYMGKEWCVRCHQDISASWERTAHAQAYRTLEKEGKHESRECLACHATMISEKRVPSNIDEQSDFRKKFNSLTFAPDMKNVQCESCHGPASRHIRKPSESYGKVDEKTCIACHNQKRDPDFDYDKALLIGTHQLKNERTKK